MKEVSADEQWTVDMDIAFTAERGFEDELKQESQVAVVPLAAAYLTMLVILTFTLGNLCVECGRLMVRRLQAVHTDYTQFIRERLGDLEASYWCFR